MSTLLTLTEYAKSQNISRQAVYTKIKKGILKSKTVDGKIFILLGDNEDIVSPTEYAKLQGISRQTVYAKIKKGILKSKTVDGKIYVILTDETEIEEKVSKLAFICSGKSDNLKYLENNRTLISQTLVENGWNTLNTHLSNISDLNKGLQKYKNIEIDEFIFFYTGYGTISSRQNIFKLILDNSEISINDIMDSIFDYINPKKQAIIIDSNYSGTLRELTFNSDTEYLSSSREIEAAYEDDNLQSSIFSYYFCEAIKQNKIFLSEISQYIDSKNDKQKTVYVGVGTKGIRIGRINNQIDNNLETKENQEKINLIINPSQIILKSKSDIKPVLGVKTVAEILASIIVNQHDDSGMMVGIFGKWGRGKTYLAEQTWKQLKEKKPKYKRVVFSAWKYQDTKSSWAYLYENFINEYLVENEENTFLDKVKSYWNKSKKIWKLNLEKHTWFPIISFLLLFILAVVWSFSVDKAWLVKSLISSFGLVVLIKLFFLYLQQKTSAIGLYQRYFTRKSYSDNLGFQSEVENELTNLLKTWIPESNKDEKVVLFVDDIDRCNIEQVISIIDGLRVILDNPEIHERLIIITAIDEKILKEALKHKYESIEENKIDMMYGEYLEKIFLIGLKLNKLSSCEIEDFLNNILPEKKKKSKDNVNREKKNDILLNQEPIKIAYEHDKVNIPFIEEIPKVEKSDYEISNKEREYLIEVIKKLENTTPRKIRIFYYKYLIMKQLFHIRLEEKGLILNWQDDIDEKIIVDVLVHLANRNDIDKFKNDRDVKVIEELMYVAEMVSVL